MKDSFLSELTKRAIRFRDDRNWKQFHSFRQLTAGLSIEASELQELFLWKSDAEVKDFMESEIGQRRVGEELSDILIYLLFLAEQAGIDLETASKRKLELNAEKYPVSKSYNSAVKYTEL